jgi:hypothetical protein
MVDLEKKKYLPLLNVLRKLNANEVSHGNGFFNR